MQVQTIQKYIHTSPRKLRLVADLVRKMEPEKALETLRFTNKAAAGELLKAIQTVLANAKQKGMEKIGFEKIEINEGPRMKRFRAGARGRAKPYKRRMSHIKIVLTDDIKVKSEKSKVTLKRHPEPIRPEGSRPRRLVSGSEKEMPKPFDKTQDKQVRHDMIKREEKKGGKFEARNTKHETNSNVQNNNV